MGMMCKGHCRLCKFPKPYLGRGAFPYLTHGYCRTCVFWIPLMQGQGPYKNRCPCCNSLYSMRPRLNDKKARYAKYLKLTKRHTVTLDHRFTKGYKVFK